MKHNAYHNSIKQYNNQGYINNRLMIISSKPESQCKLVIIYFPKSEVKMNVKNS